MQARLEELRDENRTIRERLSESRAAELEAQSSEMEAASEIAQEETGEVEDTEEWEPPEGSTAREVKERQDGVTERLRNELAHLLWRKNHPELCAATGQMPPFSNCAVTKSS